MSHHVLDAQRLLCPMPVIRTQDKVKLLSPGDTLDVICTDPGATSDIPAWCRITGHRYIKSQVVNDAIVISIEVACID